jgi:hypothetical protein
MTTLYLYLNAEPITITRACSREWPVWVPADQAREFARLLSGAADVIKDRHPTAPR